MALWCAMQPLTRKCTTLFSFLLALRLNDEISDICLSVFATLISTRHVVGVALRYLLLAGAFWWHQDC